MWIQADVRERKNLLWSQGSSQVEGRVAVNDDPDPMTLLGDLPVCDPGTLWAYTRLTSAE